MRKFLCIKDIVMSPSGTISFLKGNLYNQIGKSTGYGIILKNEQRDPHTVGDLKDNWFKEHFIDPTTKLELFQALETVKKADYAMSKKIDVPVVMTGVLKIPSEITGCDKVHNICNETLSPDAETIKDLINSSLNFIGKFSFLSTTDEEDRAIEAYFSSKQLKSRKIEPTFREVMEFIQKMPCDTCEDCDLRHMMCKCWDKETIDKILDLFKKESDK
jgi:hypothetical protein